jgi:hypothetical protein
MADVLPDFAGGGSQFKEAIPVLAVNPDGSIGSSIVCALVDYVPVTPEHLSARERTLVEASS